MSATSGKELVLKHFKWVILGASLLTLVLGFNLGRYYAYTEFTKDANKEINELKSTLSGNEGSAKPQGPAEPAQEVKQETNEKYEF